MSLAGCATGIDAGGDNPTATFDVNVGYQQAYRRVDAQATVCKLGKVNGSVHSDTRTASLRVVESFLSSATIQRVDFKEIAPGKTQVTVTVWGGGGWDKSQIDTVRKSIEGETPVCRYQRGN
jgi:hypothetical protein